jgi:TonB family protein
MRIVIPALVLMAAWAVPTAAAAATDAGADDKADRLVLKARVEWDRGEFERAKKDLDAAILKSPDHRDAHALLCSMSMLEAGMESRAFATRAQLTPLYLSAALACGRAIEVGVAPAPGTSIYALRARALVKAEAWIDAVAAYEAWIAAAPGDGRIVGGYSFVLERAGRAADSAAALAAAAARSPEFDRLARFEYVWEAFRPDNKTLAPMIATLLEQETEPRRRQLLETLRVAVSDDEDFVLLRFLDLVEAGTLTRPELDHLWDALMTDRWMECLEQSAEEAAHRLEGRGITVPKLISGPSPVYPRAAQRIGLEGRVMVLARINVDGTVSSPWVIRGTERVFAASAEEAVLARRYAPASRNGEAIAIPFTIRVDFRMRR